MSPKRSWKRVMFISLAGTMVLLATVWLGLVVVESYWLYPAEVICWVGWHTGLLGSTAGGISTGRPAGVFIVWVLSAFLIGRALACRAPRGMRPRALNTFLLAVPWAIACDWILIGPLRSFSQTDLVVWSSTLLGMVSLWPLGWTLDAEDRLRRYSGPPLPFFGFGLIRSLCRGIWGTAYRLKIDGVERIPAAGGVILAANHASYWDALFLQAACPRPIRWMIDDAYYRLPVLNWLFRWVGNIPVKAANNRAALDAAIEALKAGEVVGIFPEGFLSETGRMRRARTGVSTLAARTGAAVVTAYLRGAFFAWPKGRWVPRLNRVEVRLGGPMFLRRREDITREILQEFADAVMASIRGMFGHGRARRALEGPWDGRERRGSPRPGVGEPPSAC